MVSGRETPVLNVPNRNTKAFSRKPIALIENRQHHNYRSQRYNQKEGR